jgi:hypothetical protein
MKVGDKVSSEEADEIICAGGDCSELGWVVTKLPPEPAQTTEELLEEGLELMDWLVKRYRSQFKFIIAAGHETWIKARDWIDKVRKLRETNADK